MTFSIVTPSLNQAAFIVRTLDSVRSQTGPFAVEHIIVDACSTDGTAELVQHYAARYVDERYRPVLICEPDEGQSDALNKGLQRATGDVLAWLNADDEYEPGALAVVADAYRRTSFAWCVGNCRIIDGGGREIRRFIAQYKRAQARLYSYPLLLANDFIPQPSTFFSRALYRQAGDIDRRYHLAMDYDYWLRLGRLARPLHIDAWLARFRWHDDSKSGQQFGAAAREALAIARGVASPRSLPLLWHAFHCRAVDFVYTLLQR